MAKNKTSFKPGERPAGAGRPKGTPNKKTLEFQLALQEANLDPATAYLEIFKEQMALYRLRKEKNPRNITGASILLEKAGVTINNICQFVYPKKKAIEHSGEMGIRTFADFVALASQGDDDTNK